MRTIEKRRLKIDPNGVSVRDRIVARLQKTSKVVDTVKKWAHDGSTELMVKTIRTSYKKDRFVRRVRAQGSAQKGRCTPSTGGQ
jgi:hypothetical protein